MFSIYLGFLSRKRAEIVLQNTGSEEVSESEVAQSSVWLFELVDCPAYQAASAMGFSRQEYCGGLFFSQGIFPT